MNLHGMAKRILFQKSTFCPFESVALGREVFLVEYFSIKITSINNKIALISEFNLLALLALDHDWNKQKF